MYVVTSSGRGCSYLSLMLSYPSLLILNNEQEITLDWENCAEKVSLFHNRSSLLPPSPWHLSFHLLKGTEKEFSSSQCQLIPRNRGVDYMSGKRMTWGKGRGP